MSSWPLLELRWIEFFNDSDDEIPAFGAVRITGTTTHRSQTILKGDRSNTYGNQELHALNGPQPVPTGKHGLCTLSSPAVAAYDTGDGTPSFGDRWGPRDASWKLRKNTGGFQIAGASDATNGVVLVVRTPMTSFVGKTDASHAKGATGTISIYSGSLGAETDTGVNMTGVYNRFAAVGSGKWVRCEWNHAGQQWELASAEC